MFYALITAFKTRVALKSCVYYKEHHLKEFSVLLRFWFLYKILCVYKFMFIKADWRRSREVADWLTKFSTFSPFK